MNATAQDLFHFRESFGKLHNITDLVSLWMLEEPVQKLLTYTCSEFQVILFENIFGTSKDSQILGHKKVTKKAIDVLLNEISTKDPKQNRKILQDYIENKQVRLE